MALKLERISPYSGAYPEDTTFKSEVSGGEHIPVVQLRATCFMNNAAIILDEPHAKVHGGMSFHLSWVKTVTSPGTMDILFVVPDSDILPHLTIGYESQGEIRYTVYRAPVVSATGTAMQIYNRDENSSTLPGVLCYHTPTVTTTSSPMIFDWVAGAGKGVPSSERGTSERIMRRNTAYLFRINNQSNQSNTCSMRFDWYEQDYTPAA